MQMISKIKVAIAHGPFELERTFFFNTGEESAQFVQRLPNGVRRIGGNIDHVLTVEEALSELAREY